MKLTSQTFLLLGFAAAALFYSASTARTHQAQPLQANEMLRQPVWDSVKVSDDNDSLLLKVAPGQRFILTDLWFLSEEGEVVKRSPNDRVWLESRYERNRMVILDSPLGELPMPLRWQTGVSITGGRELWINYKSQAKTDSLRRVHFTGYLEADFVVGSR